MLRDRASGALLEPGCGWSCPSVVWVSRAGIDPAVALELVDAALADPLVSEPWGRSPASSGIISAAGPT